MINKNLALANFIVSFGSMNDYSSNVLQTKKALDDDKKVLMGNDQELFQDALAGIEIASNNPFNVDTIVNINKAFVFSKSQDPKSPGHLRNAFYNPDDVIGIVLNPHGLSGKETSYFPPEHVTRNDLDKIVTEFKNSKRTRKDGLRVFAKLSKLQPFQDGNKRTALLATNSALNTFDDQEYLTLPFNAIDHADFMVNLMRFYGSENSIDEETYLNKMVELVPSIKDINYRLNEIANENVNVDSLKTRKFKSFDGNLNFSGLKNNQNRQQH